MTCQHISLSSLTNLSRRIAILTAVILSVLSASALPTDTYAENSVLSTGRWVKISVETSGVHFLSTSSLRQMGFTDPSRVRIHGYGALRLPERLDNSYIDDLPQVAAFRNESGIFFYARGPISWNSDRPVQNPFTTLGYYFLTDSDSELKEIPSTATPGATNPTTQFTQRLLHELELTSPGHAGHILVGENFKAQPKQTFKFTLTDRVEDTGSLITSFVAKASEASTLTYIVGEQELPFAPSDRINAISDSHAHYYESTSIKTFTTDTDNLSVTIRYNCSSAPSLANLNYLVVCYQRALKLSGTSLEFQLSSHQATLSGADASTIIWDVTDPDNIMTVNASLNGSDLSWTSSFTGSRSYVAFQPKAGVATPKYAGFVTNQNLHSMATPDMVIFAPKDFLAQARRLAERRASGPDSLRVEVVDQADVFNEFSSGAADVQAFRKMLKMLYDRGPSQGRQLRYVLMFGRGTYDNRQLTSSIQATRYPKMPIWQTDRGLNDTDAYTTDDIFAFLLDNSGQSLASDTYCVSVGRLPVTSVDDARSAIDKIIEYEEKMPSSNWRNRALLVADDEDKAAHLTQTEATASWMEKSNGGTDILYDKLYLDLYPREGKVAKIAHDRLIKSLEEGVSWLTYIGHANTTSWSHEYLLTYTDINNLHLRQYPIIYAATCEFLRWDDNSISAAEIMWKLSTGGAIAVVSANRPVFISENGPLSEAFGRHIFERDNSGRRLSLGEIYSRAKNDYKVYDRNGNLIPTSNSNKLRYVLLGDPSMRPIVPHNIVKVDSINGIDLQAYPDQAVMMAMQDARVTGKITDCQGNDLPQFNGTLNITLYDADRSYTTLGLGNEGIQSTFDTHGDLLYEGYFPIVNGRFDFLLPMPNEIAGNFRPATMALYASAASTCNEADACGTTHDFYVFGNDENAAGDTIPPKIEAMYLNHASFTESSAVNPSPVLIAQISDNRAINMSTAGIGHQMILKLDGGRTFSDVAQYFTASPDGTPRGTIAYPIDDISEGQHTLMLRIWDSAGNSAEQTISFSVKKGAAPVLYDLFADANPATDGTNFYLSHDRPDAMIEVTVTVYNLLGRPLWSTTRSGRSDILYSFPIHWNLTDDAGRRVPRGIYLYRASVTSDGQTSQTATRKIAVAAPM